MPTHPHIPSSEEIVSTLENTPDPKERILQTLEKFLEFKFGVRTGANLTKNISSLRKLADMNKIELEFFLSQFTLISLTDNEYNRLQLKIQTLLTANEIAAVELGIPIK